MRFLRVVFIFAIISVVAAAASVTYITQVLDPNDLKPTLVNSAKKQQVRLELQGNITWAFWPWFGISVEKVRASSANWDFEAERLEGSLSISLTCHAAFDQILLQYLLHNEHHRDLFDKEESY